MDNTIQFTVTLTRQDVIRATRRFYFSQEDGFILGVSLVILFATGILELARNGIRYFTSYTIALTLFVAMFLVFIIYFYFIYAISAAKKAMQAGIFSNAMVWRFAENQISVDAESTEHKIEWAVFCDYVETGPFFLLVHTENTSVFSILPKRAFESAADQDRFRDLLQTKFTANQKPPLLKRRRVIFILVIMLLILFASIFLNLSGR
ncbi:MAG: YcxB family protein [Anaerolineales bacterium]|nr:YcxB family protein [Anaerolineales bacterium]